MMVHFDNKLSSLEQSLCEMSSFAAIRPILNGISLHDIQCIDVMKMLAGKRNMIIYDTGKGKTLLVSAAMRLLWNEDANRRFVMFVKKDQLQQTPKKIEDATGRKVLASAADAKSISNLLCHDVTTYSVLMLTHECLFNQKVMQELYSVRDRYCGIIVDEAHELSNVTGAQSASMLSRVASRFEYCWTLSATPITTDLKQLANLAFITSPKRYPSVKDLFNALKNGYLSVDDDPIFFINRNSSDFNCVCDYRGIIEWVNPHPWQCEELRGNALLELCKGDGATNQAHALVKLVQERKGKRGLVYVNQHSVRAWVLPFLDNAGIKYACINGNTKAAERVHIMYEFNELHNYNVIITSVTTAIDLDCDYVVFYEFTVNVKQMIGRAHRGLGDKSLDIIFMITEDTCEVDYFLENIVARALFVKKILHKDCQEIEEAERSISSRYA